MSALDRLEQLEPRAQRRAIDPMASRAAPERVAPDPDPVAPAAAEAVAPAPALPLPRLRPRRDTTSQPATVFAPLRETPPAARGVRVPGGPLAYRRRLRRLGPLAGLAGPALALLLAVALRATSPGEGIESVKAAAGTWLLVLLALPTATAAGLPWTAGGSGMTVAVATSTVAWLGVGWLAALRATRRVVATWRDWLREYVVLAAAVWAGAVTGLLAVGWFLTHGG